MRLNELSADRSRIVGTVGTTITLDGGDLSELKGSCDGLGFSLVAVLWTGTFANFDAWSTGTAHIIALEEADVQNICGPWP